MILHRFCTCKPLLYRHFTFQVTISSTCYAVLISNLVDHLAKFRRIWTSDQSVSIGGIVPVGIACSKYRAVDQHSGRPVVMGGDFETTVANPFDRQIAATVGAVGSGCQTTPRKNSFVLTPSGSYSNGSRLLFSKRFRLDRLRGEKLHNAGWGISRHPNSSF